MDAFDSNDMHRTFNPFWKVSSPKMKLNIRIMEAPWKIK